MISSVTTTKNYSIKFEVCADDEMGLLWLEVVTYEPKLPRQVKDFCGNDYKKALDYYKRKQAELKTQYGE